jgi:hypothetical protein
MKRKQHGFVSNVGIRAEDKVSVFDLTAADITTLFTAALPLVPAGGLNRIHIATRALFQFKFGTVQFTGGGVVNLVYHGAAVNLLTGTVTAGTIQAGVSTTTSLGGPAPGIIAPVNTGIDLVAATANFAAGDGTARLTLWHTTYETTP